MKKRKQVGLKEGAGPDPWAWRGWTGVWVSCLRHWELWKDTEQGKGDRVCQCGMWPWVIDGEHTSVEEDKTGKPVGVCDCFLGRRRWWLGHSEGQRDPDSALCWAPRMRRGTMHRLCPQGAPSPVLTLHPQTRGQVSTTTHFRQLGCCQPGKMEFLWFPEVPSVCTSLLVARVGMFSGTFL